MTLLLHSDGTEFFCDKCKVTIPRTRDNPFPEHTCILSPERCPACQGVALATCERCGEEWNHRLAIDLMRVDHWPPDDEQQCSCGRYTCELRTFWMRAAGVKSSKFPRIKRLAESVNLTPDENYVLDPSKPVRFKLTATRLKEVLREMYQQEFYKAGDKDYEVWLDRVTAWLLPRLIT